MRFMNGWKQTDRRGMGRTAGPKLVRAGACRMMIAWLLLFLRHYKNKILSMRSHPLALKRAGKESDSATRFSTPNWVRV